MTTKRSVPDWECDCEDLHDVYVGVRGGCPCGCHDYGLVDVDDDDINPAGVDLHGTSVIERLAQVRGYR